MFGKVVDHPLVGLLRLPQPQLLVAEPDVQLRLSANGPAVREFLQDLPIDLDRPFQIALDLFLVQAGLVELFGGLLSIRRCAEHQREHQDCCEYTMRLHDPSLLPSAHCCSLSAAMRFSITQNSDSPSGIA